VLVLVLVLGCALQEFWTGSVTRSLLKRCPAPLVVYRQ
jgi:nucleotide-binding universal stress UspA family protein